MTDAPPVLRILFYGLTLIALVGCWSFVFMYTRTWPWWRNEMGRYTVSFSTCLGLFMLYYTIRIIWPNLPGRTLIVTVLFVLLDVIIVWQLVLFIRIRVEQRRARRLQRKEDKV